ncbi:unnamed protein product [Amoebophrya sp. A120]|nr:unnamed protein product [Amoebophrya sp. A120]|eukprot:GSA120T00014949001.1
MCSFLLTSWVLQNLPWLNYFMQLRGPDATTHTRRQGFTFVHNLLHMTGDRVLQPLSYRGGEVQILFNGEIYNYREVEDRYRCRRSRSTAAGAARRGEQTSSSAAESDAQSLPNDPNFPLFSDSETDFAEQGWSSATPPTSAAAFPASSSAATAQHPNHRLEHLCALDADHLLPEEAAAEELERTTARGAPGSSSRKTFQNEQAFASTSKSTPKNLFASDGQAIYPTYLERGRNFAQLLDGEYAIAVLDLRKNRLFLATDVFGTKPLWYSTDRGLHVATYESALERLGVANRVQVPPNTILEIDLTTKFVISQSTNYEFDLRQYKTTTKDWISAFLRAVHRRIQYQRHGVFLGLSSGYDSGAINLALHKLQKLHFAYTIFAGENVDVVGQRLQQTQQTAEGNVVVFSEQTLESEYAFLLNNTEPFEYKARDGQPVAVSGDFASSGLSWICRACKKRGIQIYLSGSGADEYISDYGNVGEKIYPHSNFGGKFPDALADIFPWHSFFLGTQRDYLMKEELIAGTHGVEGRYPFLDKEVVQEYLWLHPSVKNSKYKRVLQDFFDQENYPFEGGKTGFNPHWNMKPEGGAEVQRVFDKESLREDVFYKTENNKFQSHDDDQHQLPAEQVGVEAGGGEGHERRTAPASANGDENTERPGHAAGTRTVETNDPGASLTRPLKQKLTEKEVSFVLSPDFDAKTENEKVSQRACRSKFVVNLNKYACCKGAGALADRSSRTATTSSGEKSPGDRDGEKINIHSPAHMLHGVELHEQTQVIAGEQGPGGSADDQEQRPLAAAPQEDHWFLEHENAFCFPDAMHNEIQRMEEAREELAFLYEEVHRVQGEIEKEKEKMERMREYLNEQQILVRQGSMHLVLMRLSHLEAVADKAASRKFLLESFATAASSGNAIVEQTGGGQDQDPASPQTQKSTTSKALQIVTCVTGEGVATDFPVYKIFMATMMQQGVGVVNVCENVQWTNMAARLEKYREYLLEQEAIEKLHEAQGTKGANFLYWVSDGMDVFFNDMTSVFPHENVKNVAELVHKRFAKFKKEIVFSSERLCGWGGAHLCTTEDEANFPNSPTLSKYLNAGGYLGSAGHLAAMIGVVMQFAAECQQEHLRKTRECGSGEGSPDQYLFMKYFWANQATSALDVWQTIFGNFIEVENLPCQDGWVPRCAVSPCCTRSDRIENFSPIAHGLYSTRGCSVFRQKEERLNSETAPEAPDLFLRRKQLEKWVQAGGPMSDRGRSSIVGDSTSTHQEAGTTRVDKVEVPGAAGENVPAAAPSGGGHTVVPSTSSSSSLYPDTDVRVGTPFEDETDEYQQPWHLPISWHGNGCGKWIFIMSLDALSRQCPIVAQLTTILVRDQATNDREVLARIEAGQKRRWEDPR